MWTRRRRWRVDRARLAFLPGSRARMAARRPAHLARRRLAAPARAARGCALRKAPAPHRRRVGHGKTIQTGLIPAELEQRRGPIHALVIVPATLRVQWTTELHDRFVPRRGRPRADPRV